jgi:hypothetical protein
MVAIYNLYNVAPLVSSHLAASLFIALSCHNRKSDTTQDDMATNSIKLLTGSSHPQLAELVASR